MVNSKKCFKCESIKPLNEFYKHKQMADGHLNKCKTCAKKDSIETRAGNIDYYLAYDRSRTSNPNRVEERTRYSQTESGMKAHRRAKSNWISKHTVKRAAHILVRSAVLRKEITKPKECTECKKSYSRIHAHHDDYAKPLEVRWLCSKCHCEWHKENGEGLNG